jgi:hypothetical protein
MIDDYSTVLYQSGDFSLAAGKTIEISIEYPTYQNVVSYNSIYTQTSPNQFFSYATTGTIVNNSTTDGRAQSTTFFMTVTNQSPYWGDFSVVVQALYYSEQIW